MHPSGKSHLSHRRGRYFKFHMIPCRVLKFSTAKCLPYHRALRWSRLTRYAYINNSIFDHEFGMPVVTEIISWLGFADAIFGGDQQQPERRLHSQANM